MRKLKEWHFDFVLSSGEDGQLISEQEASELMDKIIDHAEKNGLSIGGSMGPCEDDSE
jgi:hypothetical protein